MTNQFDRRSQAPIDSSVMAVKLRLRRSHYQHKTIDKLSFCT